MTPLALDPGTLVVLSLHSPREKYWGVLAQVLAAGVVVRGLALDAFEDWLRQEQHEAEPMIGPTTMFFPMSRVERLEADETVGPVLGFGARYENTTQRSAVGTLGFSGRPRAAKTRTSRTKR